MVRPGKQISWKHFFTSLFGAIKQDQLGDVAAALSYYGILALFPFLLFVVALGGLMLDKSRIQQLVTQIGEFTPSQVTEIIAARLNEIHQGSGRGLLTLSIAGALWAASGGMVSLMDALNRAYDVRET